MSEYIIYNPSLVSENEVVFFAGEGGLGIFSIPINVESVKKMLEILGIRQEIESFLVSNCRAYYYSEYYTEDEGLEDQWTNGLWFVRVKFTDKLAKMDWNKNSYEVDGVLELSSESLPLPDRKKVIDWFVIADFEQVSDLEEVEGKLEFENLSGASFYRSKAFSLKGKKFEQLVINIGKLSTEEFIEDKDGYRQKIMGICKDYGAYLNMSYLAKC